ncbi:hypothetical protein POM88_004045 [Heracleum sosnowskyi]|uniref:Uncharacterized protein n=1 Tax=Heracleum sosnowskyi TaxID=360622 RepID=A0AAD8JM17_9APIA|nr:hypothetical protein POM88_004045 [Heracleum sosnowskyi]
MDDEENFIWINLPKYKIESLIKEHKALVDGQAISKRYKRDGRKNITSQIPPQRRISGKPICWWITNNAKKQVKRKYVTAHHLQQQQRNKKPVHVEEAEKISTQKSPRLNKLQANSDATVMKRPASARRKLDLQDIPHEDEHMGENDHIVKKERPDDGEPSHGRVFVKTRKRRAGHKYKTSPSVINYRIEMIKKNIGTSGEDIQELITDGKLHGPSWLIGRSSNPSQISATAPKWTYVQDLTSKIRESIVEEVKAKVSKKVQEEVDAQVNKKVQENLTLLLKKLREANLDIKVDLGELCATISTDHEDGTHVTGGTNS